LAGTAEEVHTAGTADHGDHGEKINIKLDTGIRHPRRTPNAER
jgi:hypothetical protein